LKQTEGTVETKTSYNGNKHKIQREQTKGTMEINTTGERDGRCKRNKDKVKWK
jgi:hypothetical protein